MIVARAWEPGPAATIGLQPRDVLFQIAKTYVADMDDLGRVLEDVGPDQLLRIGVARRNVRAWTRIKTTAP